MLKFTVEYVIRNKDLEERLVRLADARGKTVEEYAADIMQNGSFYDLLSKVDCVESFQNRKEQKRNLTI